MEAWTARSCARSRCARPGPSQPAAAVVSPKTRARFDVFRFPWTVPISNVLLPQDRQNRSPPFFFFFKYGHLLCTIQCPCISNARYLFAISTGSFP